MYTYNVLNQNYENLTDFYERTIHFLTTPEAINSSSIEIEGLMPYLDFWIREEHLKVLFEKDYRIFLNSIEKLINKKITIVGY